MLPKYLITKSSTTKWRVNKQVSYTNNLSKNMKPDDLIDIKNNNNNRCGAVIECL